MPEPRFRRRKEDRPQEITEAALHACQVVGRAERGRMAGTERALHPGVGLQVQRVDEVLSALGALGRHAHRDRLDEARRDPQGVEHLVLGVSRVHVISYRLPDSILLEVFTNEGTGTLVVDDINALTPEEQAADS